MRSKKRSQAVVVKGRKFGGRQENAGRKVGSATKLTRAKANELCESGESPLDIMIDNMIFWFHKSKQMTLELEHLLVDVEDEEARTEAFGMLKTMLAARENAQRCAVDAAPYVHPRLAAIQVSGDKKQPLQMVLGTMTPQEAEEAYASTLARPK